jgi:RNA polymerase sigma-70 factor (ECF subfamily)
METKSLDENRIFEDYLRRPSRRRLARVVKAYHSYVWNLARRFTRNEEDAADLGQELFLSLLLHPPAKEAVRSVRGYFAYRILSLASNSARSRERRRQRELKAAQTAAAESGLPPGDLEVVHAAIEELPERTRRVVQYRYLAGLRNREIAEILGVSERTVEDELHAGRESLRERLGSRAMGALLFLERVPEDRAKPPAAFEEELLRIVHRGSALLIAGGAAAGAGVAWKGIAAAAALVILAGLGFYTAVERNRAPAPGPVAKSPPALLGARAERKPSPGKAAGFPAGKTPPGEDSGPRLSISGWVVDETGEVVPDAKVRIRSSSRFESSGPRSGAVERVADATTNERGEFSAEAGKPDLDSITLVAEKEGLGKGWVKAPDGWRHQSGTARIEGVVIALFPVTAELAGRVLDQDGRPLGGASVRAAVKAGGLGEPYMDGMAPEITTTGPDGSFVVKGLPATAPIEVVAEHPGYYRDRLPYVMAGGAPLELRLEKGFKVSGRVIRTGGNPVEGAGVALREDASPNGPVSVRQGFMKTGADGRFAFDGIIPERYKLTVSPPPGYDEPPPLTLEVRGPVEGQEVVLEAREEGQPNVAPEPKPLGPEEAPSIRGTISDPSGKPVVALVATTWYHGSVGFSESRRETVSRPDGTFLLQYLQFPTRLVAAAPSLGLRNEMVVEEAPGSDLAIQLEPYEPCRVEGRVVTPDGRSVPGGEVLLGRTWEGFSLVNAMVRAGRDGRFVLDRLLPDTGYWFHAVAGEVHGPAARALVQPGKTSTIEVLLPQRDATLSGTVRDSGGHPLSGIRVYCDYQEDNLVGFESLVSGLQGEFEATGLVQGKYRVLVDQRGYGMWAKEEIMAPGPPVEITLVKTRTIRFELVDDSGLPLGAAVVIGEASFGTVAYPVKGRFSAEIAETETRLKFRRLNGQPPAVERDLEWPPSGDLDLGRIELKDASP